MTSPEEEVHTLLLFLHGILVGDLTQLVVNARQQHRPNGVLLLSRIHFRTEFEVGELHECRGPKQDNETGSQPLTVGNGASSVRSFRQEAYFRMQTSVSATGLPKTLL